MFRPNYAVIIIKNVSGSGLFLQKAYTSFYEFVPLADDSRVIRPQHVSTIHIYDIYITYCPYPCTNDTILRKYPTNALLYLRCCYYYFQLTH